MLFRKARCSNLRQSITRRVSLQKEEHLNILTLSAIAVGPEDGRSFSSVAASAVVHSRKSIKIDAHMILRSFAAGVLSSEFAMQNENFPPLPSAGKGLRCYERCLLNAEINVAGSSGSAQGSASNVPRQVRTTIAGFEKALIVGYLRTNARRCHLLSLVKHSHRRIPVFQEVCKEGWGKRWQGLIEETLSRPEPKVHHRK